MYKNVVFDLDGTLIDSAPDLCKAAGVALESVDLPPIDLETTIGFIGNGVEAFVRRAIKFHSGSLDENQIQEALRRFLHHYSENSAVLTRTYPGVLSMLSDLKASGTSLGLCTNKPKVPATEICRHLGIEPFLKSIVGGDSVGVRKPDPAPLLFAVEALGGDPDETLYVGDSKIDYETAAGAGVPFVFFNGGYQRTPIKDLSPDQIISSMSDVTKIVIGK